jgi:hypothetical protein
MRCLARSSRLAPQVALLALMLSALWPPPATAQGSRLVALGDPAYTLIERLQRRGHLLDLSPTALPYAELEIRQALGRLDSLDLPDRERRWAHRVAQRVARVAPDALPAGTYEGAMEWTAGSAFTNARRLDPLRPLDADTSTLQAGSVSVYPNAALQAWLARGPFVAQLGLRLDGAYNDDPDGLDVVKRLWVREEDAYIGAAMPGGSVYAGRFGVHWAPPGADALLVSNNPRAYDRISYAFGGSRFRVRGEAGQLDTSTRDGRFTGRAGDSWDPQQGEDLVNRFLVAHRFDWRPWPTLLLSVQESALYSGENAGWSPMYVVPTFIQFFGIDNTPKNVENNGFAAGQLWAQHGRITLQGQLMLDDFDVLGGVEPTSFALAGTVAAADVLPQVDATGALTVVAARTYNTDQRPGIYVYALRGIATAFSDFVHARVGADAYLDALLPGLVVSPAVQALWQGEASFLDAPLPFDAPTVLVGTVERTLRAGAQIAVLADPRWWLRADLGVNRTTNAAHAPGATRTRFVGQVEIGARLRFGTALRLDG